MPTGGDLRYKLAARPAGRDRRDEMRELVVDAWSMVVPKKVVDAYLAG